MKSNNWVLEPGKYLRKEETTRLLNVARHRAETTQAKGGKVAIRDYFVIHLVLTTGLRVMEIAALNCSDVFLDDTICSILVRKGKPVYSVGLLRDEYDQVVEMFEPKNFKLSDG